MKLLHAADLHIGDRTYGFDRSADHEAMFKAMWRCIAQEQIDYVLLAGDVFDTRNPSTADLITFANGLRLLNDGAKVLYSPGNHDGSPVIGDSDKVAGWLRALHVENVESMAAPTIVSHDDLSLISVPYAHKRSLMGGREEVSRTLENLILGYSRNLSEIPRPYLFMGHVSVLGTFLKEESALRMGWDVAIRPEVFDSYDYVALGHIHRRQAIDRAAAIPKIRYSGVPMQMRFEHEGWECGWNIVEFKDDKLFDVTEHVWQEAPDFVTFSDVTHDVTTEEVAGNYCRWILPADASQRLIEEIRASAIDGGALGVKIQVKPKERPSRARVVVKEEVAQRPEDVLGLWLSAHGYDPEPYLSAGKRLMALPEE